MRPSDRELYKKIEEAKLALEGGCGLFANPAKTVSELQALEIGNTAEIWGLIMTLLSEIKPQDYKGGYPPLKSYEKKIKNCELFAFSWFSKKLGKKMYIKFTLKNCHYYYVSLHPCRFAENEGDF